MSSSCNQAWGLCPSWILYSHAHLSDPGGYPALARASRYFYDSGMREPVPIYIRSAHAKGLVEGGYKLKAGDQEGALAAYTKALLARPADALRSTGR